MGRLRALPARGRPERRGQRRPRRHERRTRGGAARRCGCSASPAPATCARALPAPPLRAAAGDAGRARPLPVPPWSLCASPGCAASGSPRRRNLDGLRTARARAHDCALALRQPACDRAPHGELFGFDHRLEIYVPAAQRRWGYYVLPILHRERLVARADLALRPPANVLRVQALIREDGVRRTPGAGPRGPNHALERWRSGVGPAAWSESRRGGTGGPGGNHAEHSDLGGIHAQRLRSGTADCRGGAPRWATRWRSHSRSARRWPRPDQAAPARCSSRSR